MRMVLAFGLVLAALPLAAQEAHAVDGLDVLRARAALFDGHVDEALAVIRPAAESGHPRAQLLYGLTFHEGLAGVQDTQQAIAWYEKAAAQGFPPAMAQLGNLHRDGAEGLDPDPVAARDWYGRAIALDHIGSFGALGDMLLSGEGGSADPETALLLLERAAPTGDVDANFQLGVAHYLGLGVEKDDAEFRRYMSIAAASGDMVAQSNLGHMLAEGLGGPQDLEAAETMLKDSMAQGYDMAGLNMAEMILDNPEAGDGPLSAPAHCVWALEHATEPSERPLDGGDWREDCAEILARFTPEELAEAGKIAEGLVPVP